MAVHCLVRVVSRSDRRLLRLLCHSPAEVKTALAKQLDLDPGQLVVVHQGNILHDSCNLEDLKRSPSAELNLISFILDTDQCRLAEFAKTFESVLTVPVSAITPQSSLERNVVYEIPVHNAMEFLGSHVPSGLREPLVDMGFPEPRVVKALLLNGLNVERAMEWLLDHSGDEDIDTPLTPYQVSQLISSVISSQGVIVSGRSASAITRAVHAAVARRQCTYSVTRNRYVPQQFRFCNTCSFVNGRGVCLSCAAICHAGHDLGEEISGDGFYCDCGSGSGSFACLCMRPSTRSRQQPQTRIFSNRLPFTVTDLAIQIDPSACQPFAVRLGPDEMRVLIDLLRRISESDHAEISDRDIEIVALLLDVIDQIPVHVISLLALIVRQKQGVERILQSSTLSDSLIPRITSVCIESNVQIQILRTGLAFVLNLTSTSVVHIQWHSFSLSSFSHMISVCSSLVCHGSAVESLFAVELLGNYALMSPQMPESQRRTLLSELLNGLASRSENTPLLLKILIALGTLLELVPSICPLAMQMADLRQLLDQLATRCPNLIPAISKLRELYLERTICRSPLMSRVSASLAATSSITSAGIPNVVASSDPPRKLEDSKSLIDLWDCIYDLRLTHRQYSVVLLQLFCSVQEAAAVIRAFLYSSDPEQVLDFGDMSWVLNQVYKLSFRVAVIGFETFVHSVQERILFIIDFWEASVAMMPFQHSPPKRRSDRVEALCALQRSQPTLCPSPSLSALNFRILAARSTYTR